MAASKIKTTRKWLNSFTNSYVAVQSWGRNVSFMLSDEDQQVNFHCWSEKEVSEGKAAAKTIIKMLELYINEIDRVHKTGDPPASGDENWNKII